MDKMNPQQIQFLDVTSKWNSFYSVFGLGTIKEIGRSANKVQYVASPIRIIYCLVLQLVYLMFFYIHLNIYNGRLDKTALDIYSNYSGLLLAIALIFVNLLQTKDTGDLVTKMIHCEMKFSQSDGKLMSKRSLQLAIAFSLTFTVSFAYDIFWFYLQDLDTTIIFFCFTCYMFLFYNYLAVMHFSMLQFWFQNSIDRINGDLTRFCIRDIDPTPKTEFLSRNVAPESNYFSDDKVLYPRKSISTEMISLKIRKLRILYDEIHSLSGQTNRVFANKNLIIVANNFLMIIVLLYSVLGSIVKYLKDPQLKYAIGIGAGIKGFLLTISTVSGLIWSCGKTRDEANSIARIVQSYLLRVTSTDTEKELQNFANQLLHQKINFSPHGFFALENSMLLSMLAAVASYLIILLQFMPVEQNYKDKFNFFREQ